MTDQNEQDELARCLQGDGDAYARVVARYQAQVANRMRLFSRQPLVIEELVQEVFVEAYFSLPRYKALGPFAAWLDRIATRVGYRYWKGQSRAKEVLRDDGWWRGVSPTPLAELSPTRASELVHEILQVLPPRDRLVMLLLHVEGHSVEETANLAGWSKTMVKVQAFRARAKLRTLLSQAGIESLDGLAEKVTASLADENLATDTTARTAEKTTSAAQVNESPKGSTGTHRVPPSDERS